MFKIFKAMGLNPKGDNPADLQKCIQDFITIKESKQKVPPLTLPKQESGAIPKHSNTTQGDRARPTRNSDDDRPPPVAMSTYPPKVRCYSGGDNKGEIAYDTWRYDVRMVQRDPTYTKE